ncbi:cholesterol 7-desaturase-like [Acanthaster planci]|uniref:cholesterol 7-desaturase n=1 Tax=Acanthaster planci TaxID=133434 RepID=A0A8B7YNN0_ACAPL|nr:cholesterol 7-desaturase-like [Acanthaster planci]
MPSFNAVLLNLLLPVILAVIFFRSSALTTLRDGVKPLFTHNRLESNDTVVAGPAGQLAEAIDALLSPHFLLSLVVSVISVYVFVYLYQLFFVPLNWTRTEGDVGYILDDRGGKSKMDVANEIRRRRRMGDIPPVYPNGWFALFRSFQVQKEPRSICALGHELVVYRGESGQVFVVDAYCPHLGANLGVGGQIRGDCLECPFHGWTFRGDDGKCVKVPYAEKVPDFAKIRSWPCLERNGEIYVWHHAEGAEPTWFPLEVEEITSGKMKYHGITEHFINAHVEEVPENGADIAHLGHLHSPIMFLGRDLRVIYNLFWSFAKHEWQGTWEIDEENKHTGTLSLKHKCTVFGIPLPLLSVTAEAVQVGPGIVHLVIHHWLFGDAILIHTITPVEPLKQKLTHCCWSKSFPRFAAKLVLFAECLQVERDMMVWNHKTYLSKPVLVKEDSLIAKHRRWYSQFYSENSPRYTEKKTEMSW